MDLTSLIEIAIVIAVIYFFLKLIVKPIFKAIAGIVIFIVAIYLLQRFFGFDFDKVLAPFGISLNINAWLKHLNWLFAPLNNYINKAESFFHYIWGNVPKK